MPGKESRVVNSVAQQIFREIHSGGFQQGASLPAEMLLAESYGVSRGTIRRAIEQLVESGVLHRRPHTRPVVTAGGVSRTANEVYVWVSRPIADVQALSLLKEISRGLSGTRFRMVVREPSRFVGSVVQQEEREFLQSVLRNPSVAGAILEPDPCSHNRDLIEQVVAARKYLVFVDTPPPQGIRADFVGTANAVASKAAVDHLLQLGHSRIFCAADSSVSEVTQERIRGYQRALSQAGASDLGQVLIATDLPRAVADAEIAGPFARMLTKNDYYCNLAQRVVNRCLESDPRPTALFICQDVLAFWVWSLLEGKGVSVPKEISIVGFDRLAKWDDTIPDVLTSPSQDFGGFGVHAANLLLDRLTGEIASEPRYVLLDAPLTVRSSTVSDLLLPSLAAALTRTASSYEN